MTRLPASHLLRFLAIIWVILGLGFLLRPVLLGEYVNLFLPTTTSRIHLRASHGGLALALAVFFWLASARTAWHRPALTAAILVHWGLALSTLLGIFLEGGTIPRIIVMLAVEAGLGLAALRVLPRESPDIS